MVRFKQVSPTRRGLFATVLACSLLASPVFGQQKPLARYVPLDGLTFLLEHDGLHSQPDAWKGSTTYKLLNETKLGAMLEDILTQLIDHALRTVPNPPFKGKQAVGLLQHLLEKGFVIGVAGPMYGPPGKGVFVIRDANQNETFKKLLASIPSINEPNRKTLDAPGGRKVWTAEGAPIRWWYENDDFVLSLVPPGAPDPVVSVLEGNAASALKLPLRNVLMKGDNTPDYVPIGVMYLDLSAVPKFPPRAVALGLDGIKAVEASWGIKGKATVTMLGIQAPRPRRGILALFEQPAIGSGTRYSPPDGSKDFTVASVDPGKFVDVIVALAKQSDPNSAARLSKFAAEFERRTKVNLRKDLLGKIGPRMAFATDGGLGLGSILGMWFHPPDFALVAELKDPKEFQKTLDELMASLNRELRSAGAMVPPQPGMPIRPGTSYAEFRKLKAPEVGYILAIPPSVLTLPSGFRPTVMIDVENGLISLGGTNASARKALGSLALNATKGEPLAGQDVVILSQSDQGKILPDLLTNLPSIVQFFGFAASQGKANGGPRRIGGPAFRLAMDPDAIPDAESLRKLMFPSKFTMTVNDDSIRLTGYQAFPLSVPSLNVGMETPVLIALLLPAVQAAREAARRAQCTNNLKQIGLAMFNYQSANGGYPARAITDKSGKPLLSWRVAILPFIEQAPLYNKFKLDEPWDSPHNRELIKYMPQTYMCPSNPTPLELGQTHYEVFAGEGTLLDSRRKTSIAQVADGTSNTLAVVEAENAVIWTKPDDIPLDQIARDPSKRLLGAGSKHAGGFNALMADGSVRFIRMTISPQVLRALITRAGGEIIGGDAF